MSDTSRGLGPEVRSIIVSSIRLLMDHAKGLHVDMIAKRVNVYPSKLGMLPGIGMTS